MNSVVIWNSKTFFQNWKYVDRFFYYWTLSNSHKIITSVSADYINIIPLFWIFSSKFRLEIFVFPSFLILSEKKKNIYVVGVFFNSENLLIFQDSALTFQSRAWCRNNAEWQAYGKPFSRLHSYSTGFQFWELLQSRYHSVQSFCWR